jgi:uncharacterized membrane protein
MAYLENCRLSPRGEQQLRRRRNPPIDAHGGNGMKPDRLIAFTDGVLAIVITIMVLELPVPHGADWASFRPEITLFGAYALSFVNVGIYWNNHHHMLQSARRVDGRALGQICSCCSG